VGRGGTLECVTLLSWRSREHLEEHFRRHGAELGARTVSDDARMADETVARGVRFTYHLTGRPRIGHYDARRGRFVAVDPLDGAILSLSKRSERYARNLPASTYPRH
jgi:pyocin large subunit-like protein